MKYSLVKKYKYKLAEDYKTYVDLPVNAYNDYISLDEGVLIVKKGYLWDGSSIPLKRFIPVWVYDFDKYCKEASVTHDGLSQLMREGLLPKQYKEYIDGLYRDMCIGGGLSKRNADRRYEWLRKFGDPYIEKEENPRNKIFET